MGVTKREQLIPDYLSNLVSDKSKTIRHGVSALNDIVCTSRVYIVHHTFDY